MKLTTVSFLIIITVGISIVRALPTSYILRFSDLSSLDQQAQYPLTFRRLSPSPEVDAPMVPAYTWLKQDGWRKVWPPFSWASRRLLHFAGPDTQRYLRIATDNSYYIWTRPLEIDPHQLPFLEITWGVDRFPHQAALDVYGRNDRPLVILLSFGPKVPSSGLLPDVPRALAFFWGETETVGATYTCITPRNGKANKRLQCKFPHVKYIALRRGGAGSVHTDRVNLLEYFRHQFPVYWREHRRVPPIVAVSFEAGSNKTDSTSVARLYALVFTAATTSQRVEGQSARPPGAGR